MVVVSDTSSISNLIQIKLIDILRELYGEIRITPAVQRELFRVSSQVPIIEDLTWIKIQAPTNQKLVFELLKDLDLGEAESIALAIETNADYLLIDEFLGRQIAEKLEIKIVGILGVLIQAKKLGKISEIARYVSDLRAIGFRLNQQLVQSVLEKLGEI